MMSVIEYAEDINMDLEKGQDGIKSFSEMVEQGNELIKNGDE